MTNILFIAGDGAIGALLRYWMSNGVHTLCISGCWLGMIAERQL